MELRALIEGYRLAAQQGESDIYTDSELCVNILTKWAPSWEKAGWRRKSGPIMNLDLVQELYRLYRDNPQVRLQWIGGHEGWLWNEYADSLATAWARSEL
jgi:ribonuclease HI